VSEGQIVQLRALVAMRSVYFLKVRLMCEDLRVGAQRGSRNVNIPQTMCYAATSGIEDVAAAKTIAFIESTNPRCQEINKVHAAVRRGCYLQASLSHIVEATLPVSALATFDCAWEIFPTDGLKAKSDCREIWV
jgi:hypothetical protein